MISCINFKKKLILEIKFKQVRTCLLSLLASLLSTGWDVSPPPPFKPSQCGVPESKIFSRIEMMIKNLICSHVLIRLFLNNSIQNNCKITIKS